MPVKKRANKKRAAVNEYEAAWLNGEEFGWLIGRKHTFIVQELWDRAGDHENFSWEPGMDFPEPKERRD